jgi:hypothetical protein
MSELKIEEKQDIYSIRKRRSRKLIRNKKMLSWLGIIVLVSLIIGAFTGIIPYLIEKFYEYKDTGYRPMDKDRMIYEQEQQSSKGAKKRK